MAELYDELETRPYLLYLNQIIIPEVSSELPEAEINKIAESLGHNKINLALPLACLTEEEDQYQLLTGLPIYQAAEAAKVQKIWVFLIAKKQPQAEEALEQFLLQSRLNQRVAEAPPREEIAETQAEEKVTKPQGKETVVATQIEIAVEEPQEFKEFFKFINDANSDLKSISGIGKEYAKKIADQRPYMSLEDMRNKLGSKAPVKKWLKAYQQKQS